METARKRIIDFIESQKIKPHIFLEKTGLKKGFIDRSHQNSGATDNYLSKILDVYPEINPEWLLTGRGEMLKESRKDTEIANPNQFNVKLVSQYAYAGYLSGYGDTEYIETLPTVPFIIPDGQTRRGQYMAFEVSGESMDDNSKDSILEGDIALGRLVRQDLYQYSKLHYRQWSSFIIVTKNDGIVIKEITDHNVGAGTINIHSLNPDYPDLTIHLKDVVQIFNVVQLLRKKM